MRLDAPTGRKVEPLCHKVVLNGEVSQGHEWRAELGEGWVFRVVPVAPSGRGYTGWDLAVDRVTGGGYPDALLLATPPYGSLNEREIATTFGLRAQDAIAWGPRRFRFLTSTTDVERAKPYFQTIMASSVAGGAAESSDVRSQASAQMLRLMEGASAGQFEVMDAKLKIGTADPPAYAEQWATRLGRVPHTVVPSSTPSARGELLWVRFAITLWEPRKWVVAPGMHAEAVKCAQ